MDTVCTPALLGGARHTMEVVVMGCVVGHALPAMDTLQKGPKPLPVMVTDTLPAVLMLAGAMEEAVGRMYCTVTLLFDAIAPHMTTTAWAPTSFGGATQVILVLSVAMAQPQVLLAILAVQPVEKAVPLMVTLPPPVPTGPETE